MDFNDTIKNVICGLIDGDVPLKSFSTEFGVREGRRLEEWIAHERKEFTLRRKAFGIDANSITIRIDRVRQQDVTFSVLGRKSALVYQDTWQFDLDGRIEGNGSQFEIVPKILFRHTGEHSRNIAIRSPRGKIISVVPISLAAEETRLINGLRSNEDGFSTFQITIPDDDCKGFKAKFRIADDAGVRSTETVWMRGIDEPGFIDDGFPVVHGSSVVTLGTSPSWSLSVVLETDAVANIDYPKPGEHQFDANVVSAILTDTHDHDWSVSVSCQTSKNG